MKNTTPEEVQYGKRIWIYQDGERRERFYPVKVCKGCGEQIKVRLDKKGHLPTNSIFTKGDFCDRKCYGNWLMKDDNLQENFKRIRTVEVKLSEMDLWLSRKIV